MEKQVFALYGFILGLVIAVVLLAIELPGKPGNNSNGSE